uniref:Uncharacterized protein n=1 Tax=Echeneis naucrates TaxID=173247 RepID=A0A665SW85_ECHNA
LTLCLSHRVHSIYRLKERNSFLEKENDKLQKQIHVDKQKQLTAQIYHKEIADKNRAMAAMERQLFPPPGPILSLFCPPPPHTRPLLCVLNLNKNVKNMKEI